MNITQMVTIALVAPVEIPEGVYVTLTDNVAHTYTKKWNGEPLTFNIPVGFEYIVNVNDFVSNEGKAYFSNKNIKLDKDYLLISFTGKTGIELKSNTLIYYSHNTDWYININPIYDVWGKMGISCDESIIDDIIMSDKDGYSITHAVANIDNNSICKKAQDFNGFENGIIGYIPSYSDIEIFSSYLPDINKYISKFGFNAISFSDSWVSETHDENNAWTTNGQILPKNISLKYFIFGKRVKI
jgi:hypothetical protein